MAIISSNHGGCISACCRCCSKCWAGCLVPTCEFRGCCAFPHGTCYTIMGIIMAVGGVFMNMYVLMSCFFHNVVLVNPITNEPIEGSERGYGFLSREIDYGLTPDYRQCIYYPDDEKDLFLDAWVKAGKAFAIMSGIIGFICLCILTLACCLAFSPATWERWMLWMYIIAAICISFSFLSFGSDFCEQNKCKVAQGGGWAISTFLFWLICANTVKSMSQAMPSAAADDDDDDDKSDDEDDLYYEDEDNRTEQPRDRGISQNEAEEPYYNDRQLAAEFTIDEEDESDPCAGALVPVQKGQSIAPVRYLMDGPASHYDDDDEIDERRTMT